MEPPNGHNEVTAGICLETTWRRRTTPSPFASEEERAAAARENEESHNALVQELESQGCRPDRRVAEFNDRYGTPRRLKEFRDAAEPESEGRWPGWFEVRDMIAVALGANEPEWLNGSWWHDRRRHALDWVDSASDVRQIAVPDWGGVPAVKEMLDARQKWHDTHPDEPVSGFKISYRLNVPGGSPAARSVNYPAFVDVATYLMGMGKFLAILGGDVELADALMDKCFELSTGYTDFLLSVKPEKLEALCGFGGDGTCMLSPDRYQRYGAAWDARLFEYVRAAHGAPADLPCNYHSCGPSGHLYEQWGAHPCHANLSTMQTRFLPGQVKRLRENLPNVQLELTVHPQHYDVARAEPSEVKQMLQESARDAGFRDVHFTIFAVAHQPSHLSALDANVQALGEAMDEISREGG